MLTHTVSLVIVMLIAGAFIVGDALGRLSAQLENIDDNDDYEDDDE